jgi:prevent-host-death family protein
LEDDMRTVGAFEAKTHLSQLLDAVEQGEEIVITRRGKEVARLVKARPVDAAGVSALAQIRELSKGQTLGGVSIRALIDEGRRF